MRPDKWCVAQNVLGSLVAAGVMLAAVAPLAVAADIEPGSVVVAALKAGPVQHEYMLAYSDPEFTFQAAVPQPSLGVTYVKWQVMGFDGAGSPAGVLLRSDGRVAVFHFELVPGTKGTIRTSCEVTERADYVDVASGNEAAVGYLRSEGKMVYRSGSDQTAPVKQQPPALPVGLSYVSLDAWSDSWIVMRSDGQAVVFLVEKITPGQKVASGIERITTARSIVTGTTAKITAKVASRAILDDGTAKVTYKGKTIGKAVIKMNTKMLQPKKSKT